MLEHKKEPTEVSIKEEQCIRSTWPSSCQSSNKVVIAFYRTNETFSHKEGSLENITVPRYIQFLTMPGAVGTRRRTDRSRKEKKDQETPAEPPESREERMDSDNQEPKETEVQANTGEVPGGASTDAGSSSASVSTEESCVSRSNLTSEDDETIRDSDGDSISTESLEKRVLTEYDLSWSKVIPQGPARDKLIQEFVKSEVEKIKRDMKKRVQQESVSDMSTTSLHSGSTGRKKRKYGPGDWDVPISYFRLSHINCINIYQITFFLCN